MLTLSAATWVRIPWRWKRGTTTSWEKNPLRARSSMRKRARPLPAGGPKARPTISPSPRTSWRSS